MGGIKDTTDAMMAYDYLVNHIGSCDEELPDLIVKINNLDASGQFLASTARFLSSVDKVRYGEYICQLVEDLIAKDRERKYIGLLITALWGEDYEKRLEELINKDSNFRRIYKRLHPNEYNKYII